jgi:hypothetical protein
VLTVVTSSFEDPAAKPRPAVLGHDVHTPDMHDMTLLDRALAMTARNADEAIAVEGAKETIEIRLGVLSQTLGPYFDRVDLLRCPAERLGMLDEGADPQRAKRRSIAGRQRTNEHDEASVASRPTADSTPLAG